MYITQRQAHSAINITILICFFFLALERVASASEAQGAACRHYLAPVRVRTTPPVHPDEVMNPAAEWGRTRTDSGVIVDGYVGLPGEHSYSGVDLSSNNVFMTKNFTKCPPSFAVIRLDDKFLSHTKALAAISKSIEIVPYFLMTVQGRFRRSSYYKNYRSNELLSDSDLGLVEEDVSNQVRNSLSAELSKADIQHQNPIVVDGQKIRFMVVDAEFKLIDEKSCSLRNPESVSCRGKQLFGQLYAHQICAWAKAIQGLPGGPFIPLLYTTPSVYSEYLRYASVADDDCIGGLPVWVARTRNAAEDATIITAHGEDTKIDSSPQKRDLCTAPVPNGNRCIMHQYTHRGELGANALIFVEDKNRNGPWHIDLDRLFDTRVVTAKDASIVYYVRKR